MEKFNQMCNMDACVMGNSKNRREIDILCMSRIETMRRTDSFVWYISIFAIFFREYLRKKLLTR